MEERVEKLEKEVEITSRAVASLNDFREETRENFRLVRADITRLDGRIDKLDARIDKIETRMDRLETRMERLEEGQQVIIDLLREKLK